MPRAGKVYRRCGGGPFASTLGTCAVARVSAAVPVVTREFTKLFTVVALKITRTSPTSPSVKRTVHADGYPINE